MTTDEFKINSPDCKYAQELAGKASEKVRAGDFVSAIPLIEDAIRLDQIAALNSYHLFRVRCYSKIKQQFPRKAMETYNRATRLQQERFYRDAASSYKEAAAIDPLFLWPLNNLAWMLSTTDDPEECNGVEAVTLALDACEKSNWSCWAFLGTLAAAYAASGDFEKAVGWQQASIQLVPSTHRNEHEMMLRAFQTGQRYVDELHNPAAGGRPAYNWRGVILLAIAMAMAAEVVANLKINPATKVALALSIAITLIAGTIYMAWRLRIKSK
jgi:tetratricopeptide (TPR) repeat protein